MIMQARVGMKIRLVLISRKIFFIKIFSWNILGKEFLIRDSRSDNAAVLLLCKQ